MSANANAVDSIRGIRLACSLTQQALATAAGCSISMVRIAERGYTLPASPVVVRMLDVLAERRAIVNAEGTPDLDKAGAPEPANDDDGAEDVPDVRRAA